MKRVTIYWPQRNNRSALAFVHQLQEQLDIPQHMNVNGEQYLEVNDEQMSLIEQFQAAGHLQIRYKELEYWNGHLRPVRYTMSITNIYTYE